MRPLLLDINVLIALTWPSHVHHRLAQEWFARRRSAGFRTCPLTQLGFVRISCNRNAIADAVSPRGAMALLQAITALPEHSFWPDDVALGSLDAGAWIGHRQVADAYLVALARKHRGAVATLDRGLTRLEGGQRELIELLG